MSIKLKKNDYIISQLGLQFGQVEASLDNPKPDAEEMAALLDNGLDAARKKQVLAHLACDPELYSLWLQLIESAQQIKDDDTESVHEKTKSTQDIHTNNFINQWRHWLQDFFYPQSAALGGGFATIAVIVMAVIFTPDTFNPYERIDGMYDHWGEAIATTWTTKQPQVEPIQGLTQRSFFAAMKQSSLIQNIRAGFSLGAKQMGMEKYQAFGLNVDSFLPPADAAMPQLIPEQTEVAQYLGKLIALNLLQCQLQDPKTATSRKILLKLIQSLSTVQHVDAKQLSNDIRMVSTQIESVCHFTHATIKRF